MLTCIHVVQVNVKCTRCPPGGTFAYHGVQKKNLFMFCQFNIPFTFDGACLLYRSFGAWPEIAEV